MRHYDYVPNYNCHCRCSDPPFFLMFIFMILPAAGWAIFFLLLIMHIVQRWCGIR